MNMTASDETLSRYHGQFPLDEAAIRQLKDALLQPSSSELPIFLESAIDTGTDRLSTDQMTLMRKIVERSPHLFAAQLASVSFWDRRPPRRMTAIRAQSRPV
jgi:hypothetical protein